MANVTVTVDGKALPSGLVSLKRNDELLWSEGTGRGATDGKLVGSVVARKQTYSLQWGMLTQAEYDLVKGIKGGFVPVRIAIGGATICNMTGYRSNVSGDIAGYAGGRLWWKNVSVDLIER